MLRVRILLAAVLALTSLAVLAGPAGASTPAANSRFCAAVAKIGQGNAQPSLKEVGKTATAFKNAAKTAPSKVKSAMNNISKLLRGISGSNPSDLAKAYTSKDFIKNYSKSIGVYVKYYIANCGQ
jgi:hypothetical protein